MTVITIITIAPVIMLTKGIKFSSINPCGKRYIPLINPAERATHTTIVKIVKYTQNINPFLLFQIIFIFYYPETAVVDIFWIPAGVYPVT